MIKLASWNVAGLRACVKKGFVDWLDEGTYDVVALQETKALWEQLPEEVTNHPKYDLVLAPAEKKGYSGVAFFIKKKRGLEYASKIGLDEPQFDCEGRTVTLFHPKFILINGYYPNGQRDHGRVPYKLEYSRLAVDYATDLQKKNKDKPVILCGDFNTAHHPIDLANPKTNKKTTGFLPNEREFLDQMETENWRDVFRLKHPDEEGHYTWWTFRNNCRERNIGWRIDYFWLQESWVDKVKKAQILSDVLGSDHCPLDIHLSL